MRALIVDEKIDLQALRELSKRPPLFQQGENDIWTDEHISKYMLKAHLDPDQDTASRAHDTIEESCRWITSRLDTGSKVIDLGCGPGLYCKELARHGLKVTGVDFSKRSIEYARSNQGEHEEYILGNYLSIDIPGEYDAALMIYYDFGVFDKNDRDKMFKKVRSLLTDEGVFIFDVLTPAYPESESETTHWSVNEEGGFWRPYGYLELFNRYCYPEERARVEQYVITDENGNSSVYRLWHQFFTITQISNLLKKHGFVVEDFYGDLTGGHYAPDLESIGLIARKM
ncbi:MAG: methyltransferase domain-containing protein [Thermoplasmata archaeon]